MKKNSYQRFIICLISSTLTSLGIVALLNIIIDPYIIFKTPKITHFNKLKPEFGDHVRLSRYISLSQRTHPIIFLGSSRIGGMDVEEMDLPQYQNSKKLGVPGAHIDELKYYLEYALKQDRNQQITEVILGLDFYMFTTQPNQQLDFIQERVDQKVPIKDLLAASLSLSAIDSSYQTILYNRKYTEYPTRATTDAKFERWLGVFLNRGYWYNDYEIDAKKLNDLREILQMCEERNIKVSLFISPVHATHSYVIRLRGLWPMFEQWKREIVKIHPVWDFSGYNTITVEPINVEMTNYIDNSHYSSNVGKLILLKMSGQNAQKIPDDFGQLLTPDKIENHLDLIRQQERQWKQNHPQDVEFVEQINQEQLEIPEHLSAK